MNKLFWIPIIFFLASCATPVGYQYDSTKRYEAVYKMEPTGFWDGFTAGATYGLISPKFYDYYGYGNTREEAQSIAKRKCYEVLDQKNWHSKAQCRSLYVQAKRNRGNSYSYSSSGSGYSSNSFSTNKAPLFYDKSTGGMRECLQDHVANGQCLAFKAYTPGSYDKNTLFYNKETNSMQPCSGIVTVDGKCTAFGIYNSATANKNQLFYDKSRDLMTTCSHVGVLGDCLHYDISPKPGSTVGSTGFRSTNPNNVYHKRVPQTPQQSIQRGMDMLGGRCTLGLNC